MELNINENLKHPIFDSQFGKVEQIQTDHGPVTVCFMSNHDSVSNLTLEFEKKTLFHIFVVWILTAYSFISNNTIALWVKMISEPKKSRKEILWKLGRNPYHYSSFFYDRFSPINHDVKVFAASWQALDMFYNYHQKIKPHLNGNLNGFLTRLYMGNLENRQSVTNRYKLVSQILMKALPQYINGKGVRIISIASGAAQALIETIEIYRDQDIEAILIDLDETALAQAKNLVDLASLGDRISFIKGGPNKLVPLCEETKPEIIEMIGFLDYRPKDKAISLIKRIYDSLPEGGLFLTCNIRKNSEKPFLDWVVLWPMIYRNEQEFTEILIEGGFSPENIQLIYEPFRIHGIAVCRK